MSGAARRDRLRRQHMAALTDARLVLEIEAAQLAARCIAELNRRLDAEEMTAVEYGAMAAVSARTMASLQEDADPAADAAGLTIDVLLANAADMLDIARDAAQLATGPTRDAQIAAVDQLAAKLRDLVTEEVT